MDRETVVEAEAVVAVASVPAEEASSREEAASSLGGAFVQAEEGISPTSEEYYERLDAEMRRIYPNELGSQEGASAPVSRATNTVAPSSRNNSGRPRQYKLKPSQVDLSRKLGITPEQYAVQLAKEQNRER